jgi:NAD/NADP transhydrogenase beta subunit
MSQGVFRMPQPLKPEVLPPDAASLRSRTGIGRNLFADENLDLLAHVLDDWFRIPGTSIRFGLDGIIGLVPGLGDILAGLASCIIVVAAWFRGVPYVTLLRMVVNLGLDVMIGAIPILGDAFDIAWKANRRNYALLARHLGQPHKHTWKDYAFLAAVVLVLIAIFAFPALVILWILARLARHL